MKDNEITYREAASILSKSSGFMDGYDYTLNPYSGCTFGCTYCYAAFFSRSKALRATWGHWVEVKQNALSLLEKFRHKSLYGKSIYMSSVTDPYQPIEKKLALTRALLLELLHFHQPRLVVQTRSPLITRDVDILTSFNNLQVNMTITTDDEIVRKVFEPLCPSNKDRLKAISTLHSAGIACCITLTPLLPIKNAGSFVQQLLDTGVEKFIIQPFHSDKGRFVAGTRDQAMGLLKEQNWTIERYNEVLEEIRRHIPAIGMGKEGFSPI